MNTFWSHINGIKLTVALVAGVCLFSFSISAKHLDEFTCPNFEIVSNVSGNIAINSIYNSGEGGVFVPTSVSWYFEGAATILGEAPTLVLENLDKGTYQVCVDYDAPTISGEGSCIETICSTFEIEQDFTSDDCDFLDCVFPGDTDNDFQANVYDVLPIGRYFGEVGLPRTGESYQWEGLDAPDWGITTSEGVDLKHVDCNGDGIIGMEDIVPIMMNYHNKNNPPIATEFPINTPNISISFEMDSVNIIPDENQYIPIRANVYCASHNLTLDDLYGIAFSLKMNFDFILPGSVQVDNTRSSFLGDSDEIIAISQRSNTDLLDVAISRINRTPVSGFGRVASIDFTIIGDIVARSIPPSEGHIYFPIEFDGLKAVNLSGQQLDLRPVNGSIKLVKKTSQVGNPKFKSEIDIFPNPSSGNLRISLPDGMALTSYSIINFEGRPVQNGELISQHSDISIDNLSNGVYFIRLTSNDNTYVEKIQLLR